MTAKIFIVDAFAERAFTGNPAAVVPLDRFLSDAALQAIAAENNLAETAFIEPEDEDWNLRWFTPTNEVPLCGHATLASAYVILNEIAHGANQVRFHTRKSGVLSVRRSEDRYVMNFPALLATPCASIVDFAAILGCTPTQILASDAFYMAVLSAASDVRALDPDISAIRKLDRRALIVTAPGDGGFDCVSRFFAPSDGVDEDPVTGGAHCMLAPYWTERLDRNPIRAYQASRRGGSMTCRVVGDRVELEGGCVSYLTGTIRLPS